MSPHPSSPDNDKLSSGTMIVLIREQLADQTAVSSDEDKVYRGREVTRIARIKSKPEPDNLAGISGVIVLRAVFSASGKVTDISVVSGPPGRSMDAAIDSARRISFEPAIKDGRYVSMYFQLEYHFRP